jgi:hypothetical protein
VTFLFGVSSSAILAGGRLPAVGPENGEAEGMLTTPSSGCGSVNVRGEQLEMLFVEVLEGLKP